MIVSVSKELCLGSLQNASVVYIMVNWGLIVTADIKFLFTFPIYIDVISHAPHIKRNYFPCSKKKELLKVKDFFLLQDLS
jgi:hypothetical protein